MAPFRSPGQGGRGRRARLGRPDGAQHRPRGPRGPARLERDARPARARDRRTVRLPAALDRPRPRRLDRPPLGPRPGLARHVRERTHGRRPASDGCRLRSRDARRSLPPLGLDGGAEHRPGAPPLLGPAPLPRGRARRRGRVVARDPDLERVPPPRPRRGPAALAGLAPRRSPPDRPRRGARAPFPRAARKRVPREAVRRASPPRVPLPRRRALDGPRVPDARRGRDAGPPDGARVAPHPGKRGHGQRGAPPAAPAAR